jgi:hypothetical protein
LPCHGDVFPLDHVKKRFVRESNSIFVLIESAGSPEHLQTTCPF